MFTFRPTSRLITRLRAPLAASLMSPMGSTTALGDWYANIIYSGRRQLVLAISERTLLPVLISAAPAGTLVPRLRVGLGDVLRQLEIDDANIERELTEMSDVIYGKTQNRQVTGVLVDFAKMLPFYVEDGLSLLDAAVALARTSCSPLHPGAGSPDRATAAVFAARPRPAA